MQTKLQQRHTKTPAVTQHTGSNKRKKTVKLI